MIKKTLLYVSGLALAAGGPITVFSGSDMVAGVKQSWFGKSPAATSEATQLSNSANPVDSASTLPSRGDSSVAASQQYSSPGSAVPSQILPAPHLTEALNFNVTVEWIMQRWPRVSTGLPHLQLQGYRVPLMTGSKISDVAGSLTYYFNAQQQLQRIAFRGTTGDPSPLAAHLTGQFHFTRRLTNDPGLVLFETVDSNNQSVGTLKIRLAKVIKADQPHSRFELDLTMDRPGNSG